MNKINRNMIRSDPNFDPDYFQINLCPSNSVPTDRRSFRTGSKKILEDRFVQDLKIAKRTSKDGV